MEGGKRHAKPGQNVWICYEGCKNALHQAIQLRHQCPLIKGLRQCTLAPPTVMNDCRLFGNSQRIYVANPHLACHTATHLQDAPRRTRLLSVSSTRLSLKKQLGRIIQTAPRKSLAEVVQACDSAGKHSGFASQ